MLARRARIAYGSIVVSSDNAIRVFAPTANGNVAPVRVISGAATDLDSPWAIDIDRAGRIWVANLNGDVVEYAAAAHDNAAPIRIIPSSSPTVDSPDGIALSRDGKDVWVGNDTSATLSEFSTAVTGGSTSVRTIAGANTDISFTHDVTVSPNGAHLWQAGAASSTLQEFSTTGSSPNQTAQRVIALGDTNTTYPEGAAVDLAGNVWTSDQYTNALLEYGIHNDSTPIRTITGTDTHVTYPSYVSLDANGRVWEAVYGYNFEGNDPSVEEFSPNAYGDAIPLVRIAGPLTQLSGPTDVEVFGIAPRSPRSLTAVAGKRLVRLSWRRPSDVHGGLLGYIVRQRASAHSAWKVAATLGKTTTKLTVLHRHPGHKYRYDVIAYNEFGRSAASKTTSAVPHK